MNNGGADLVTRALLMLLTLLLVLLFAWLVGRHSVKLPDFGVSL